MNQTDDRFDPTAEKAAKRRLARKDHFLRGALSDPDGRAYFWDLLEQLNILHTSFSTDPSVMAFNEGQRNVGLMLLSDVMRVNSRAYIQMMEEQNADEMETTAAQQRSEDS